MTSLRLDGRPVSVCVPSKLDPGLTRTAQTRGEPRSGSSPSRPRGSDWFSVTPESGSIPGLYGLKPIYAGPKDSDPPPSPLRFTADKFITADDILVSVIRVHNPTDRVQTIRVDPIIQPRTTFAARVGRQRLGVDHPR